MSPADHPWETTVVISVHAGEGDPMVFKLRGQEQKYRSMSSALLKLAFMARRIVAHY